MLVGIVCVFSPLLLIIFKQILEKNCFESPFAFSLLGQGVSSFLKEKGTDVHAQTLKPPYRTGPLDNIRENILVFLHQPLVKVYSRIFAIAAMYTCFSFWLTLKAYQMPSRYREMIVWSWRKIIITSFPLSISCLEEDTSFCYKPHHTYTLLILAATTANIFPFLFHFKPSELHVAGTSLSRPNAQSPISPGREHLQGCSIHSSSGQPWTVISSLYWNDVHQWNLYTW